MSDNMLVVISQDINSQLRQINFYLLFSVVIIAFFVSGISNWKFIYVCNVCDHEWDHNPLELFLSTYQWLPTNQCTKGQSKMDNPVKLAT